MNLDRDEGPVRIELSREDALAVLEVLWNATAIDVSYGMMIKSRAERAYEAYRAAMQYETMKEQMVAGAASTPPGLARPEGRAACSRSAGAGQGAQPLDDAAARRRERKRQ